MLFKLGISTHLLRQNELSLAICHTQNIFQNMLIMIKVIQNKAKRQDK